MTEDTVTYVYPIEELKEAAVESGRIRSKNKPIKNDTKDCSMFGQERYQFFLNAPFEISNQCCKVMKKAPAHNYSRQNGMKPMTAQMAEESRLRTQQWIIHGCNGFDMREPVSNPMSFWTEQDVLEYIHKNDIQIADVYGEVKQSADGKYFTTKMSRTGCMFCGFGCHREKPGEGRFELMKESHPKLYDYIMKPWNEGGLNYKEVIDWINEHGDLEIRY